MFEEILNNETARTNLDESVNEDLHKYQLDEMFMNGFKVCEIGATARDSQDTYISYLLCLDTIDWFRISLIVKY